MTWRCLNQDSPSPPAPRRWAGFLLLGLCLIALPADAADKRFAVKVSGQSLQVGQAQKVQIKLTADAPWHMNMEYPTSMKLSQASGLQLNKTKFKKGDATILSEHKIVFEVPVVAASAGRFETDATIKFAICKADSCSPASTKVKLRLNAKAPQKPQAKPQEPTPEPKASPKPRPKRSAKPRQKTSKPKRSATQDPRATGSDPAAQKAPFSVYLIDWVLAPVLGTGMVHRVLDQLSAPPKTP